MKKAIILHGTCSEEEFYNPQMDQGCTAHWLPWLQKQLLIRDIMAETPQMPKQYLPDYKEWENLFNAFAPDKDTLLVGHSCGGGFLLRWLSENDIKVGKVVLVAPWLDPDNVKNNNFFNFRIDPLLVKKTRDLIIFESDDDNEDIKVSVEKIRRSVKNIDYKEFHNYGHFCYGDMKTREFPELLEEVLR